jgi:HEPN domain-containing protein
MQRVTREGVAEAEQDFLAAMDLGRRRKQPVWDLVCFHCQQCAEKYLKARMHEAGMSVPKSHDLDALLNLLLPVERLWVAFRAALQNLSDYAVDFRYPGRRATKARLGGRWRTPKLCAARRDSASVYTLLPACQAGASSSNQQPARSLGH